MSRSASDTTGDVIAWLETDDGMDWSRANFRIPSNQRGRISETRMFSLEPIVHTYYGEPNLKGAYIHRGGATRLDPDACQKQITWEEYADWWVKRGSRHA